MALLLVWIIVRMLLNVDVIVLQQQTIILMKKQKTKRVLRLILVGMLFGSSLNASLGLLGSGLHVISPVGEYQPCVNNEGPAKGDPVMASNKKKGRRWRGSRQKEKVKPMVAHLNEEKKTMPQPKDKCQNNIEEVPIKHPNSMNLLEPVKRKKRDKNSCFSNHCRIL